MWERDLFIYVLFADAGFAVVQFTVRAVIPAPMGLIERLLQRSESGLIAEIGLGMFGLGFKIIAAGHFG